MKGRFAITTLILAILLPPVGLLFGILVLARRKNDQSGKSKRLAVAAVAVGASLSAAILAIIGLAYLGVFSPTLVPADMCLISMELVCNDFFVTTDSIELVLENRGGRAMIIDRISFSGKALKGTCSGGPITIEPDHTAILKAKDCNIKTGDTQTIIHLNASYKYQDGNSTREITGGLRISLPKR